MTLISSSFTFPCISWWAEVIKTDKLIIDTGEHFQKMSYRNRYKISGANNSILLSVPLVKGRDQKAPVSGILIHNDTRWQIQHWRALVSTYRRSPFFEHYEPSLKTLFETRYDLLSRFNEATILWVKNQLKLPIEIGETRIYQKLYGPEIMDIRNQSFGTAPCSKYYQVFEDRTGFIPDLSILDLLFSEGPATKDYLASFKRV